MQNSEYGRGKEELNSGIEVIPPSSFLIPPSVLILILLFDPGLLASQGSQVIQLAAADLSESGDLNLVHLGGVYGKNPFHAHTGCDLPDSDGRPESRPVASDDDPLEDLDPFLLTLNDPVVDFHSGSDRGVGNIPLHVFLFVHFYNVHENSPNFSSRFHVPGSKGNQGTKKEPVKFNIQFFTEKGIIGEKL
jgi:hypothetical protein